MITALITKLSNLKDLFGTLTGSSSDDGSGTTTVVEPPSFWSKAVTMINRVTKLTIIWSIEAWLWLCVFYPAQFTASADALGHLPEYAWILILTVLGSFVGVHVVNDYRKLNVNPTAPSIPIVSPPTNPEPIEEEKPMDQGRFNNINDDDSILDNTNAHRDNPSLRAWRKRHEG